MAVYIVTYDLNKVKDYPRLYEAITSAGTDWAHAQDSVWFVVSQAGSVAVRDYLREAMDSDDFLFVGAVADDSAWALPEKVSEWLKARL